MKPIVIIAIAVVCSVVVVLGISEIKWYFANQEYEKSMREVQIEFEVEQQRIEDEARLDASYTKYKQLPTTYEEAKQMSDTLKKQLKNQCEVMYGLDTTEYDECIGN
jgi:spore coat protein CotH